MCVPNQRRTKLHRNFSNNTCKLRYCSKGQISAPTWPLACRWARRERSSGHLPKRNEAFRKFFAKSFRLCKKIQQPCMEKVWRFFLQILIRKRRRKEAKIMSRNACWSFSWCPQCNHSNFRSWLKPVVITSYLVVLCVALPLTVWELHKNRAQTHVVAWFIAGCFVFLTIPISVWGILQHLVNYTKPELQRRIVRYRI